MAVQWRWGGDGEGVENLTAFKGRGQKGSADTWSGECDGGCDEVGDWIVDTHDMHD